MRGLEEASERLRCRRIARHIPEVFFNPGVDVSWAIPDAFAAECYPRGAVPGTPTMLQGTGGEIEMFSGLLRGPKGVRHVHTSSG